MENRSHALLAGLFLLIMGAAAVTALWWFSGRQDESRQYVVETRNNVTGLNAQAQVRYRGIRVGKVESIHLDPKDPRSTLIDISVRKDVPITRGTTAKLGSLRLKNMRVPFLGFRQPFHHNQASAPAL